MSCNPSDFYELAQNLSKNDDEVSLRACISRGYYSAYHYALSYVFSDKDTSDEPNSWIGGEGGVHQKLISHLEKSKNIKEKSVGYILRDLRAKRVIADYYLNDNLHKEDAETMFKMIDSLIEKLGIDTKLQIINK